MRKNTKEAQAAYRSVSYASTAAVARRRNNETNPSQNREPGEYHHPPSFHDSASHPVFLAQQLDGIDD